MEADLTQKIREVIKEKLIALDSYVDNELPEYIMVMVANKKSKECMERDLSLFLGKNTSKFTAWLLDTLEKMEADAAEQLTEGPGVTTFEKESVLNEELDPVGVEDEEDMLALNTDLLGDELLSQDAGEVITAKVLEEPALPCDTSVAIEVKTKPTSNKRKQSSDKPQSEIYRSSAVRLPDARNDDEYDPLNPSVKSVASFVKMEERKSSVPVTLQANKLLLLKAVEAANKSIVGKQNMNEIYKPTPIKVLEQPPVENLKVVHSSVHRSVSPAEYIPKKRFASESSENRPIYHKTRPNLVQIVPEPEPEEYSPKAVRNVEFSAYPNDVPMMDVSGDEFRESISPPTMSPQFVVTLDGINANSFKDGKWSESPSESSDTDNGCAKQSDNIPATAPNDEKTPDRCRFWPLCKNGDSCIYFHPAVPCKAFPNCNFGGNCHFVHPNCKFDSLCSRKDCPYTHLSRRVFGITKVTAPVKFQPVAPSRTMICKFFPNCSSYSCPYRHPKKCRFGNKCRSSKCPFTHPAYPARNKLTWKSPI